MKLKMRTLIQAHIKKSCGWKKGSKKTKMRRNQCPAEVRTQQNVFKAQEDEKNPNVTKIFFHYCVDRAENLQQSGRKSPTVLQKTAQLRETFNKHFPLK